MLCFCPKTLPIENLMPLILKKMRLAGHVARIGKEEVCSGFWWVSLRERDYLENTSVDREHLNLTLKKLNEDVN
jgi:hypothetical protein